MKNLLLKLTLLTASLFLSACSLTMDGNNGQTNKYTPAIVENAQESVKGPGQPPKLEQAPPDQNTLQSVNLGTTPVSNEPVGGSLEKGMDETDKIKMFKALDKTPGKTTSWTNNRTGVKYEVTPVRKVVVKDNPYCRSYQMTATHNNSPKEVSGTACVSNDGVWHSI